MVYTKVNLCIRSWKRFFSLQFSEKLTVFLLTQWALLPLLLCWFLPINFISVCGNAWELSPWMPHVFIDTHFFIDVIKSHGFKYDLSAKDFQSCSSSLNLSSQCQSWVINGLLAFSFRCEIDISNVIHPNVKFSSSLFHICSLHGLPHLNDNPSFQVLSTHT